MRDEMKYTIVCRDNEYNKDIGVGQRCIFANVV